eukprot:469863-Amphidinium_carterae.1
MRMGNGRNPEKQNSQPIAYQSELRLARSTWEGARRARIGADKVLARKEELLWLLSHDNVAQTCEKRPR